MRYKLGAEELIELGANYRSVQIRTPFLANRGRGPRSFGNWGHGGNLAAVRPSPSLGANGVPSWLPWAAGAAVVLYLATR